MIVASLGRAFALALSLAICTTVPVQAHSLPGSTLTFSQVDGQVRLSVSLPLEDLIIAAPEFADFADIPLDQALSAQSLAVLAGYFEQHLAIQDLSPQLSQAVLRADQNDHVGTFVLLVAEMAVPGAAFPLQLQYDGVMHEVRSHRAYVYWQAPGGAVQPIEAFGYRRVDGAQQVIWVRRP